MPEDIVPAGSKAGQIEGGTPAPATSKPTVGQIVLGLDDSEGSRAAARWCAGLAVATGARVTTVHGLGRLPEVFLGGPEAVLAGLDLSNTRHRSWKEEARSSLERWCAPLREAGVAYQAELADEDAVDALLRVARRDHADLIVVGAQGHGWMVSRLLGSVPYKLAHHAQVPVVIVPSAVAI
jgi:nucleotide-binding universal stress UspA family protein